MESIIERIKNNKFWKFYGGIHPPSQKFLTSDKPIRKMAIPPELRVPVRQHIGEPGEIIVSVGDYVLKGQPLTSSKHPMAVPIHASTSGKVTAIAPSIIAHPSGLAELCVFIEPDGLDRWRERSICNDYHALSKPEILDKIRQAGISGMGGAGFPSHIKAGTAATIDYLIINAAECEPYITADDLLMREQTAMIIDGIEILEYVISPKIILIGIEDNKPQAITALKKLSAQNDKIQVCVLPTIYPTGGEKQLIQVLTGKEVPSGVLPSALGIVMQNVGTCYAIADAVLNDKPLVERVVTVSGQALEKPQNLWTLLGTPVQFLLDQCNNQQKNKKHIIMGGPMMGFSLPSAQVPVVKITNCVLAPSEEEIPENSQEVECIRCGQCAEVCPSQLLPQELQWSAKAKDQEQLQKLNLFDCIECGACAYVCPSHIPLVHYYRIAKAEIRQQQALDIKAEKAKQRFEARKARLEREKKAREEKQKRASEARKARMNSGTAQANKEKSAVAAALARVKAKKNQSESNEMPTDSPKSKAAEAIARAKAKKLAKSQEPTSEMNSPASVTEADKASSPVAAAVARAKAKKALRNGNDVNEAYATQSSDTTTKITSDSTSAPEQNNKAKRVAAAITKAKAKKSATETQGQTNSNVKPTVNVDTTSEDTPEELDLKAKDSKAARIAAAVANAKAKAKVKKQANEPSEEESSKSASKNSDDRAAKIAAAVAKAKAKAKTKNKIALEAAENKSSEIDETIDNEKGASPIASVALSKKDKIAAAIAKAKAKKQQQLESE